MQGFKVQYRHPGRNAWHVLKRYGLLAIYLPCCLAYYYISFQPRLLCIINNLPLWCSFHFFNCRLYGFFFFYLLVGQPMSCLRTPNREKQYSLHMVPHCIRCLSYSLHPTIQMSGFPLTSEFNHAKLTQRRAFLFPLFLKPRSHCIKF